jgi:SSS family solute:Na+ symporter
MTLWLAEHWLAVLLLGLYTGALMANAYAGLRASKSLGGYYVGNRNMSGPLVGLSFFATFASTNSYIGHAGKGYEYGLAWMTMPVMLILFTFLSWRWIGPRTRVLARNFDALTLPDFLAARFLSVGDQARHPLRIAAAAVVMMCSLLYLVAVFKGAGHLFEQFFNVPYDMAIGLALIVVMLYTSIGGFVSVVRTDALQGVLMMIGAMMIFYFVTGAAGGVAALGS